MKITIDRSILSQLPEFNIIALSMDVTYEENNIFVEELIKKTEKKISEIRSGYLCPVRTDGTFRLCDGRT